MALEAACALAHGRLPGCVYFQQERGAGWQRTDGRRGKSRRGVSLSLSWEHLVSRWMWYAFWDFYSLIFAVIVSPSNALSWQQITSSERFRPPINPDSGEVMLRCFTNYAFSLCFMLLLFRSPELFAQSFISNDSEIPVSSCKGWWSARWKEIDVNQSRILDIY